MQSSVEQLSDGVVLVRTETFVMRERANQYVETIAVLVTHVVSYSQQLVTLYT